MEEREVEDVKEVLRVEEVKEVLRVKKVKEVEEVIQKLVLNQKYSN